MAERTCRANLQWDDYNGEQCATADTARLRRIANVSGHHYELSSSFKKSHLDFTNRKR